MACHVDEECTLHIFDRPFIAVSDGHDLRARSVTINGNSAHDGFPDLPDITVELGGQSPWYVDQPVTVLLHRGETVTEFQCTVTDVYPEPGHGPDERVHGPDVIQLGGDAVETRADDWELVGYEVVKSDETDESGEPDQLSGYTGESR